jgi:hypothetical protein
MIRNGVRTLAMAASAALCLGATPALAQETIATGADAPLGGAPPPPPAQPLDGQRPMMGGADNVVRSVNACGVPPKEDGTPDKSPHGEVYASVGNHGYREAGGVVCVPIGDHVAATIAVDAGQSPSWGWRQR